MLQEVLSPEAADSVDTAVTVASTLARSCEAVASVAGVAEAETAVAVGSTTVGVALTSMVVGTAGGVIVGVFSMDGMLSVAVDSEAA